jgi:ubiquinone/menaquinone biosynthesis C-methylase UbiE
MSDAKPEFDRFSASYERLLNDPLRDRFSSGGSAFFHARKRDLIRDHFRRCKKDTRKLAYLDVGCGKGQLLTLLRNEFARVAGCDPSACMLDIPELSKSSIETRVQENPDRIPFGGQEFDLVTAVCVFHHIPPFARRTLLLEMCRVLKPGGTIGVIEHNPYNPVTRLIVSRTPVDADAILLRPVMTRRLFREAGLTIEDQRYFLYFPSSVYEQIGSIESAFAKIPLGGQYAVFGHVRCA